MEQSHLHLKSLEKKLKAKQNYPTKKKQRNIAIYQCIKIFLHTYSFTQTRQSIKTVSPR